MAGYTLATLEGLMRSLIFEGTGDIGLVTPTQAQEFIQIAHRRLYADISEVSPSTFAIRSADKTVTANGNLDIGGTAIDTVGIHRVIMLEYKDSQSNYRQLLPFIYQEKDQFEGPSWRLEGNAAIFRWTMIGFKIYLYPQNSQAITVRLTYVPVVADINDGGGTPVKPFGGNFVGFHEIIAYGAAVMALEKDKHAGPLLARYDKLLKEFKDHVVRLHKQRPRSVIGTDWTDPF